MRSTHPQFQRVHFKNFLIEEMVKRRENIAKHTEKLDKAIESLKRNGADTETIEKAEKKKNKYVESKKNYTSKVLPHIKHAAEKKLEALITQTKKREFKDRQKQEEEKELMKPPHLQRNNLGVSLTGAFHQNKNTLGRAISTKSGDEIVSELIEKQEFRDILLSKRMFNFMNDFVFLNRVKQWSLTSEQTTLLLAERERRREAFRLKPSANRIDKCLSETYKSSPEQPKEQLKETWTEGCWATKIHMEKIHDLLDYHPGYKKIYNAAIANDTFDIEAEEHRLEQEFREILRSSDRKKDFDSCDIYSEDIESIVGDDY